MLICGMGRKWVSDDHETENDRDLVDRPRLRIDFGVDAGVLTYRTPNGRRSPINRR